MIIIGEKIVIVHRGSEILFMPTRRDLVSVL